MIFKTGTYEITTGIGTMVISPLAQRVRVGDTIRWVADRPTLTIALGPGQGNVVTFAPPSEPQTVQGTAAKAGYFSFTATVWLADRPPVCDVAVLIIDP